MITTNRRLVHSVHSCQCIHRASPVPHSTRLIAILFSGLFMTLFSGTALHAQGTKNGRGALASLTIRVTPSDARIRIMDIKPRYRPGVRVIQGLHRVRIEKAGYLAWDNWINVKGKRFVHSVRLKRIAAKSTYIVGKRQKTTQKYRADGERWKSLDYVYKRLEPDFAQLKKLIQTGKMSETIILMERMVKLAEESFPSGYPHQTGRELLSTLLNSLSRQYQRAERYADAKEVLKRSIQVLETLPGSNGVEMGDRLLSLAQLYLPLKQPKNAFPYLKRARQIFGSKSSKLFTSKLADTFEIIGVIYFELARYSDSKTALKRSLALRKSIKNINHIDIARVRKMIIMTNKFKALLTTAPDKLDKDQIETLFKLISTMNENGYVGKINELAKRYVAATKVHRKEDGTSYVVGLSILTSIYLRQGRLHEAKQLIIAASNELDENNPSYKYWHVIHNSFLAKIYTQQGRLLEAEKLLQPNLVFWEKSKFPIGKAMLASTLSDLALIYSSQAQFEKAEIYFKRSLAMQGAYLSP